MTGCVEAEIAGEKGDGSGEIVFGGHSLHGGFFDVPFGEIGILTSRNAAGRDDVGADLRGVSCGEVFAKLDEAAFGDSIADGIAHSCAFIEAEIWADLTVDAAEKDDGPPVVGGELGSEDLGDFEGGSDTDVQGFLPDFGGLVFDFFGPTGD